MKRLLFAMSAVILLLMTVLPKQVSAETVEIHADETETYVWTNEKTGHTVKIWVPDFSEEEELSLASVMQPVTQYCDAAVVMDYDPVWSLTTQQMANAYAADMMDTDGVLLYFDMDRRELYLCTKDAARKTVTDSLALSITDNVYEYASRGDYLGCCMSVFEQVRQLYDGNRIAQPMKLITSVLFAIITGLLLNFVIVAASRNRKKKTVTVPYFESPPTSLAISNVQMKLERTELKSSDDSGSSIGGYFLMFLLEALIEGAAGSGGGGHSGGGHGGGSFGGGGHRF